MRHEEDLVEDNCWDARLVSSSATKDTSLLMACLSWPYTGKLKSIQKEYDSLS